MMAARRSCAAQLPLADIDYAKAVDCVDYHNKL